MNFKTIFLIGILISSFLAISCDSAACLNVRSRPQGNCGDGIIQLIDNNEDIYAEIPIKYGSDIQGIKLDYRVKRIAFKSVGRGERFNADIRKVSYYLIDTHNSRDINVDVNFYKKSGYYNVLWIGDGWWSKRGYYHDDNTGDINWHEEYHAWANY